MSQHRTLNAGDIGADFLTRCFAPGESIALLLRRENPEVILQRIAPLKHALAPRYLGWLAHENSIGANVYVAANPVHSGSRKRTKESIAAVRHLYLDLDTNGDARLASLWTSDAVPTPNAIVSTSLGKYQVLWRVDGFTLEQQESALKLLAVTFGGDPACTDCIFTELVGIQMLLMNTLEPLLRGDKFAPEQLTILFRQVQTAKAAKAQELLAKRSQNREK
jgi:hypothetical protein